MDAPVVWFVGAGPGDPDLITMRGNDLLVGADVLIYAGSLVNPTLVERSRAEVKLDSWGMKVEEMVPVMVDAALAGKRVVRLHSGDPALYGSIVEQIAELERHGVEVRIIPGVSSLFAASAALKTQYTLKGVSETLIITRPAGETLEEDDIAKLSEAGTSMVIFLGTDKLAAIVEKLRCPPDTPAAVIYHASWPDQKIVQGCVSDIAQKAKEAGIHKTALIIIGGIVDPMGRYHRSVLYS
ncbi:MAG: cobalt-precorrin-4/precorrin-4 C(11)-methyltransferase [Methanomassiliicoccus sp.]|nr:cobalt-precorrin-4/precorrin-4 C(11)-methyltransferase [Methanomassiliicoccus sp.]